MVLISPGAIVGENEDSVFRRVSEVSVVDYIHRKEGVAVSTPYRQDLLELMLAEIF